MAFRGKGRAQPMTISMRRIGMAATIACAGCGGAAVHLAGPEVPELELGLGLVLAGHDGVAADVERVTGNVRARDLPDHLLRTNVPDLHCVGPPAAHHVCGGGARMSVGAVCRRRRRRRRSRHAQGGAGISGRGISGRGISTPVQTLCKACGHPSIPAPSSETRWQSEWAVCVCMGGGGGTVLLRRVEPDAVDPVGMARPSVLSVPDLATQPMAPLSTQGSWSPTSCNGRQQEEKRQRAQTSGTKTPEQSARERLIGSPTQRVAVL